VRIAVIEYLQLHARWSGDDAAAAVDNDGTWRGGVSRADASQTSTCAFRANKHARWLKSARTNHKHFMTAASTRSSTVVPRLEAVEAGAQANGVGYFVAAAAAAAAAAVLLLLLLLPPLVKPLEQHYAPVLQALLVSGQRLAPRVGHQHVLAWGGKR
jgi:hypothetical protein